MTPPEVELDLGCLVPAPSMDADDESSDDSDSSMDMEMEDAEGGALIAVGGMPLQVQLT